MRETVFRRGIGDPQENFSQARSKYRQEPVNG